MDRKSQSGSGIFSKTNRQFYVRKKKSPEEIGNIHIGKVLKSLLKNKQKINSPKHKYQSVLTQNKDQHSFKTNDKIFEIAQIKRMLQNNVKKANVGYNKLLKSFEKCLNSQSIEQIQFYQLDFYETFNQIVLIQIQKNKNIQISNENENKMKKNQQNALLIQNLKLEKENMLLRRKFNYTERGQIFKQVLDDVSYEKMKGSQNFLKTGNKELLGATTTNERKLQVQNQQMQIMKREIETYKEQIYLLRQEKRSLRERINELKLKNQNLCSQIIGLQLNNKKIGVSEDKRQAIMMMQTEQIQSYRRQIWELKKLYINLNKKYKGLIIKFKKSSSENSSKIGGMYSRQSEVFPQQFEAFEQVRGRVHNSIKIHTNPYNKEKKLDKSVIYQQFFGIKQTLNNRQGIKKTYSLGMQYYNPTFYGLIAEDMTFFGIDQNNFEHFNQTIKLNFIGTLRAIMDSKFNEFVMKKQGQTCSSFPSFVLAWLNTFQINDQKKIQKLNGSSISTRETICMFYANLMSQKLNYSWEIIAFREFLLETFNNDELYFYLSLRYLLVGGDMCRDLSYCFQEIYYVDFNRVFSMLGKIIKQNDVQSRQIFEDFIKKSIIYVRKKSYLDLHQILRILLQYYQNIKQRQIDKILKTIEMIAQNRNSNINLLDFLRIFDYHFTFLTQTEIIELYRRCYCVGNGNINPCTIVTVLIQQNIFLRWVQTFSMHSPISIEEVQNVDWDINFIITPNINWLYQHEKQYRFLYNTQLKRQCSGLGIQHYAKSLNRLSKLDSNTIFERLEQAFQVSMMFARKFYYSGVVKTQQLQSLINLLTEFTMNLSKLTIRRNEIHFLMKQIKFKAASAKIVRFYYKKKAQMTRSILYAYSSNVMKDQQQQKTKILRTQFMQIIQQAKSKKNLNLIMSRKTLDYIQQKI